MKFLTFYAGSYIPKNQLERDQVAFLEKKDRIILGNSIESKAFLNEVIQGLNKINSDNHRCKPASPAWGRCGLNQIDYFLDNVRVVEFYIYRVDKHYSEA